MTIADSDAADELPAAPPTCLTQQHQTVSKLRGGDSTQYAQTCAPMDTSANNTQPTFDPARDRLQVPDQAKVSIFVFQNTLSSDTLLIHL